MNINLHSLITPTWHWLINVGPDVIIILIIAAAVHHILSDFSARIIRHSVQPHRFANKRDIKLREATLMSLMNSIIKIIVWAIAGLMIFSRLFPQVNLAALGASAGILGVVIGFGAQSLIRDFLAGIFILLENQYRVGDYVTLYCPTSANVAEGKVTQITLRVTVLRDDDGSLNVIPNGTIARAVNQTFDYSQININIKISADSNLDIVQKLIGKVSQSLQDDAYWSKWLINPLSSAGIRDFDSEYLTILLRCKVAPGERDKLESEIRRRLLIELQKSKIKLG